MAQCPICKKEYKILTNHLKAHKNEAAVEVPVLADIDSTSTAIATGELKSTEVAVEESTAKKQFREFMEGFRRQNPYKYAINEAELLKKLNSL